MTASICLETTEKMWGILSIGPMSLHGTLFPNFTGEQHWLRAKRDVGGTRTRDGAVRESWGRKDPTAYSRMQVHGRT